MVSIIIPVFNEGTLPAQTAAALRESFPDAELIFSDDGSTDKSPETLLRIAAEDALVRLAGDGVHRGKGAALRAGIAASAGDPVIFTDCDLAYGTAQIRDMLDAHRSSGAAATAGSRVLAEKGYAGYSPVRRFGSALMRRLIRAAADVPVSDPQTGLKCFDGDSARTLAADCRADGFAFDAELLHRFAETGAEIREYPVSVLAADGQTGHKSSVHLLRDSFRIFRELRKVKADRR